MNVDGSVAPLLLQLRLTEEQRQQIRERTGLDVASVPVDSGASTVRCEFGGIELRVVRGVFVPLPSAERLLRNLVVVAARHDRPVIVEVGTGSGAVALAAAAALPAADVYATDISPAAVRCARQNRTRLGLHNVQIRQGSLLSPLPRRLRGQITAIVANVPYLPPGMADAASRVFPPGTAVGTGADGLGLPRQLAVDAREFLVPGGFLILQLAEFQWAGFAMELASLGFAEAEIDRAAEAASVIGRAMWARGDL